MNKYYIAIDIGAGNGTRVALFNSEYHQIDQVHIPLGSYGETFEEYFQTLCGTIDSFLLSRPARERTIRAIGVATAGILGSDGRFILANNLKQFIGYNLKTELENRYKLPVGIENDANAGALAEWSVLRVELLYWVFGGGWGGAWVNADGEVKFPALDWRGTDRDLDFSNEPGYAIPLKKHMLKALFIEHHVSWDRFERILVEEFEPTDGIMRGPSGDPDDLRAEIILSGPGRCRIFRAVVADDDFYERFLDIHESVQMRDPSVAGRHISKLSSMRVEAALTTDQLFGKILAHASKILLKDARTKGLKEGCPICMGGKPSYALPFFGPAAQAELHKFGFTNYLRPSIIDEQGGSANLVGASVVAWKAASAAGR